MALIAVSCSIDARVDEVFAKATDLDSWADTIRGIVKVEKLTDGPIQVGTRFRETRVMFGKERAEEMEFTKLDPPRSYEVQAESCGARYITEFRFESTPDGTHVSCSTQVVPLSLMAKLMSPLSVFMKGMLAKCILQDLEDIKSSCEGQASFQEAVRQ